MHLSIPKIVGTSIALVGFIIMFIFLPLLWKVHKNGDIDQRGQELYRRNVIITKFGLGFLIIGFILILVGVCGA